MDKSLTVTFPCLKLTSFYVWLLVNGGDGLETFTTVTIGSEPSEDITLQTAEAWNWQQVGSGPYTIDRNTTITLTALDTLYLYGIRGILLTTSATMPTYDPTGQGGDDIICYSSSSNSSSSSSSSSSGSFSSSSSSSSSSLSSSSTSFSSSSSSSSSSSLSSSSCSSSSSSSSSSTAAWSFDNETIDAYNSNLIFGFKMEDPDAPLTEVVHDVTASLQTGSPTYQAGGVDTYCVKFNGAEQFATATKSFYPSGDFTLSFWMALTGSDTPQQVLGWAGVDVYLAIYNLNQVKWDGEWARIPGTSQTEIAAFNNGSFYHLVLRRSGTTRKLFLNGVLYDVDSTGSTSFANQQFLIGRGDTGTEYYSGRLDEIYLWDTALTDAAILELYNYGNGVFLTEI